MQGRKLAGQWFRMEPGPGQRVHVGKITESSNEATFGSRPIHDEVVAVTTEDEVRLQAENLDLRRLLEQAFTLPNAKRLSSCQPCWSVNFTIASRISSRP